MDDSKGPVPSYNTLWALAFSYANSVGMMLHRCEQFASDYALYHVIPPEGVIISPALFVEIAASLDYHYHG